MTHFYSNLMYKMGQIFFDIQYDRDLIAGRAGWLHEAGHHRDLREDQGGVQLHSEPVPLVSFLI